MRSVFNKVFSGTETVSQNTVEPLSKIYWNLGLWPSWYSDRIIAASQNVLAVTKVKPYENPDQACS